MNKTKVIALSLIAAGALTMTGCGSSSGSSEPTPTPTATPAPTPAPTAQPTPTPPAHDIAKAASVDRLDEMVQAKYTVQFSNSFNALLHSVTSAVSSEIVEAGAAELLIASHNLGTGDIPCAALGQAFPGVEGISGTIHAEATTLAGGGNGYRINMNECKFDTGDTFAASSQADISFEIGGCVADLARHQFETLANLSYEELNASNAPMLEGEDVWDFADQALNCVREAMEDGAESLDAKYKENGPGAMMMDLAIINAVDAQTASILAGKSGKHAESSNAGTMAHLDDTWILDGTLEASAQWIAIDKPNIHKQAYNTTFAANNARLEIMNTDETVSKIKFSIDGSSTGDLSVSDINDPTAGKKTFDVTASASSTMDAYLKVDLPNQTWDLWGWTEVAPDFKMGVNTDKAAYNAQYTHIALTGGGSDEDHVAWNDEGNGYSKAYFHNNKNDYELNIAFNADKFKQERAAIYDHDNSQVDMSQTYAVNGKFGMGTAGIPVSVNFLPNLAGSFDFATDKPGKLVYDNNYGDYKLAGGRIMLNASDATVSYDFVGATQVTSPWGDIIQTIDNDPSTMTQMPAWSIIWLDD